MELGATGFAHASAFAREQDSVARAAVRERNACGGLEADASETNLRLQTEHANGEAAGS